MTDSAPLIAEQVLGSLRPVNKAAQDAFKAVNGRCVVKLTKMTRNQRRRGFYFTLLDVVSEVLRDRTNTPWDAETLHDELRKILRLYDGPPLKTPSGREVFKLKSTSDRSMTEAERAHWTDRVVAYCEHLTGVEAKTLIDEVRARGGGEIETSLTGAAGVKAPAVVA